MMFIGFAYLMTFMSRYSWSAVGFNFLISILVIQVRVLLSAFLQRCRTPLPRHRSGTR